MDRHGWWVRLLVLLVAGTATAFANGCSGNCRSRAQTTCQEGISYWTDSCGKIEVIKEQCACGCDENHSACLQCGCTCSQVGECCDGCHSLYEGEVCDDQNPETINDLCTSGVCAGWNPADVALPALPAEPALPSPPEPVHLRSWTCPTGWQPVVHPTLLDENGQPFSWCQPPPVPRLQVESYLTPLKEGEQDGDRPICTPATDGTYPVLGFTTCQPLGDPCPTGEWPDIPADVPGNRIYVRAGATGGDGSQAAPYGTIGAAAAAAAVGDVVVLGAGTFPESVTLSKDLTVWGSCVQGTAVDAPGPHAGTSGGAIIVEGGASVEIRNLRISGAQIGVQANSNGKASLKGVWIHQATRYGILASVGTVQLFGVLVDSTNLDDTGSRGYGIEGTTAGSIEAAVATLEWNRGNGILLTDAGTSIQCQDLVVRGTAGDLGGEYGSGLIAYAGSQVNCMRCLFDANRLGALVFTDPGTTTVLEDLSVSDTQSEESSRTYGAGLVVHDGAVVTVRRGLLMRNRSIGLEIDGDQASVTLEDSATLDTKADEADGTGGYGIQISSGAQLLATRLLIEHNRGLGIGGFEAGSHVDLTDVVVRSTESQESDGSFGRGIYIGLGATLVGTRLQIEDNRDVGIIAREAGTDTVLQDVVVRGTRKCESGSENPAGIHVTLGAHTSLIRGLLERNHDMGFFASDPGTHLELSDVSVTETLSDENAWTDGEGMWLQGGSKATCQRCLLKDNRTEGVEIIGTGTSADLEDLTVLNTSSQESDHFYGHGLGAAGGAQATVTRGLFDSNRDIGIIVGQPGTSIALNDVTVKNTIPVEQDDTSGVGIQLATGCQGTLSRVMVSNNRTIGIDFEDSGTTVDFEDLIVQDTQSQQSDRRFGVGLQIAYGTKCRGRRGLFERNKAHGIIVVEPDTTAVLEDITVRNTACTDTVHAAGSGLMVGLGAQLVLDHGLFDGNHEVGIGFTSITEPPTSIIKHVQIVNTLPRECALGPQPSCPDIGYGIGMGIYNHTVEMTQVESSQSALAGLQLARLGTIRGAGLSLHNNPIGVNLQELPEGYDFLESVTGLWMEDNQVNFDSSALPVPDPLADLH